MTKHYCDACGKERDVYTIAFPYHLTIGKTGYVQMEKDEEDRAESSRLVVHDICLWCKNRTDKAAWEVFQQIKKENEQ